MKDAGLVVVNAAIDSAMLPNDGLKVRTVLLL
jgi:hypothetical protein